MTKETCAFHGDDRFVPALCQYALRRRRARAGVERGEQHSDGLLAVLEGAEEGWAELEEVAANGSREPWLVGGATAAVAWDV